MSDLPENSTPLGNLSNLAEFHPILYKYFNGLPIMNVAVEIAKELDKLANGKSEEKPSKESLTSLRVNIYRLERLCDSWLNTGHYSNVPDRLRLLYSFLCALLAKLDFLCEDYLSSLRFCDEGLLKGHDLEDESLSKFASRLCLIPTKNQKKKLVPTNNNALIKLSALTTLYEVFPDVPPKTIKHFAKENGYNFELTANCLLNISESFDAKLDLISTEEQLEEQQNSINIIVPSKNPNIIIPYGAPPPNKKDENGGSQLLEQLDFERRHCLSMANQVRGKPHGGALCGHYMRRN
uniref:CUE domain-containing protein n=1 Tax=Meloidogyne javanica TaxID=6303 RepID=A0A915LG76_MELJA